MIINIIVFLWLLFVLAALGIAIYNLKYGRQLFLFQNYAKVDIPYIIIGIQGHPLNMIVDTGAAVSIICENALQNLSFEPCQRSVQLNALTNESVPARMVTIPLTLKSSTLEEDFVVHPTEDLADFGHMHGITIHGILGNEFLERTGCRIDYKKHTVTLH